MAIELITGRAGTPHVDSSDMRALYAEIVGRTRYLLNDYDMGVAEMESANDCHLMPAELLVDGAHVRITGDGEVVHIDNGSSSYDDSRVETVSVEVVKGTPVNTGGDARDPNMPSGSATILDGSTDVYIPYVRVKLVGLVPQTPELIVKKIDYNLSTAGVQLDLYNSLITSLEGKVSDHTKAVSRARTICGTKIVSVSNMATFVLFQASELSSLASSVGGKASVVAAAATNGDWNAKQAKIEATLIQNNALLCYLDAVITGSIRVNYAITFTV